MGERTKIVSTHFLRRSARKRERAIQEALRLREQVQNPMDLPLWARGVRVEKAGPLQWAVVLTERRGR